jgi:four helix bundle protein
MSHIDNDDVFGFERLDVWEKAVEFACTIYDYTSPFPKAELFGMTSQLRRAAVSIAANIAEGVSRTSPKDQARFFEIAYGSVSEVVTILHIAFRQHFITGEQIKFLRADAARLCRMLSGLRRSALERAASLNSKP